MTEEDRILARRVLDKNRLSSDQVRQVLAECGRSGRSFRDVVLGRGLASVQDFLGDPPKELPTTQVLLLFAGLMILLAIALTVSRTVQERSHPRAGPAPAAEERAK